MFIKVYELIISIILITIVPVKPHAVVSKREPRPIFSQAGVKLTNIVGPRMLLAKVEPFDIPFQQCGDVCDQHDHTKFVFLIWSNISAQQMCA